MYVNLCTWYHWYLVKYCTLHPFIVSVVSVSSCIAQRQGPCVDEHLGCPEKCHHQCHVEEAPFRAVATSPVSVYKRVGIKWHKGVWKPTQKCRCRLLARKKNICVFICFLKRWWRFLPFSQMDPVRHVVWVQCIRLRMVIVNGGIRNINGKADTVNLNLQEECKMCRKHKWACAKP